MSPQSILLVPNSPRMKSGNRINNRLVFKIRGGYKLILQTPETMKLFGSTKKKKKTKQKMEKRHQSCQVLEVVLVHCNSVDN